MLSRGVLVHHPSGLGAAVAILAAELSCRHGMLTNRTLERAKTVHQCDGVMSHNVPCEEVMFLRALFAKKHSA